MLSLKKNEQGRATFMPITAIKAPTISQEMKDASGFRGFIAFADDLVTTKSEYMNIVSYMLGRIAVFDNIDNATEMAKALKYRVRAITLDGQQINVGGSFTGGSVKHGQSILSRAGEIKKLEDEIVRKEGEIAKLAKELKATEGAFLEAQKNLVSAVDKLEDWVETSSVQGKWNGYKRQMGELQLKMKDYYNQVKESMRRKIESMRSDD
jgi:chromosome segregation protein